MRDCKIGIIGLDNCGKTAIVNSIHDKNLSKAIDLPNTRCVSHSTLKFKNVLYFIWDFGGARLYLDRLNSRPEMYLTGSDQIILVLDIHMSSYFAEFLHLVSQIIRNLNDEYIKESLGKGFKILFLFNRADNGPYLNLIKNYRFMKKRIKELNISLPYKITITSLYSLQRNKKYFNSEKVKDLGSLVVKLFSYSKMNVLNKIISNNLIKKELVERISDNIIKAKEEISNENYLIATYHYERAFFCSKVLKDKRKSLFLFNRMCYLMKKHEKELKNIEKEFKKIDRGIKMLSIFFSDLRCPKCGRRNTHFSLRSFCRSTDPYKISLRKNLINLIKTHRDCKFNIRIGIPCCSCFNQVFENERNG